MKKTIRVRTFETNSSSTHAICIAKDRKYTIPHTVTFYHGEFGWEVEKQYDTTSYLYEMINGLYDYKDEREDVKKAIEDILYSHGVENIVWEDEDTGYIDHVGECYDLMESLLNDEEKLLTFLFGDSFIVTGNDNDDGYSDMMYMDSNDYWSTELKSEFNDYDIYEKGN